MDVGVFLQVHDQAENGRHDLPATVAMAAPATSSRGQAEQAENQDGVKDDVDDGAHQLRAHGEHGPASGLQQPLKAELAEHADRAAQADGRILRAVVHDASSHAA